MKRTYLIAVILLSISGWHAAAQDTAWLDVKGKPATPSAAFYRRIKIRTDSGWRVTDHFVSGQIKMTGVYSDSACTIKNGEFVFYDTQGDMFESAAFVHNAQEGKETLYYKNGQLLASGDLKQGKMDGEWKGYYRSGALSSQAIFKDSIQISASFFHEDGTPDPTKSAFMQEAEFPGGRPAFYKWLNGKLRYPQKAVNREIKGTVVVAFTIMEDGKIKDLKIIKSVDPLLDNEALRVMAMSPDWLPNIEGGLMVSSRKMLPIVFDF